MSVIAYENGPVTLSKSRYLYVINNVILIVLRTIWQRRTEFEKVIQRNRTAESIVHAQS